MSTFQLWDRSINLSICLPVYLSVYLSISICLSVYSFYLFVCLLRSNLV